MLVTVKWAGGVKQMTLAEIDAHNRGAIELNVAFGLRHKDDYPVELVEEYKKEAYQKQEELMKKISANPDVVLRFDVNSGRYVIK